MGTLLSPTLYIDNDALPAMDDGTGMSYAEFLRQNKPPYKSNAPSPGLCFGDFGEILVADYMEFRCLILDKIYKVHYREAAITASGLIEFVVPINFG